MLLLFSRSVCSIRAQAHKQLSCQNPLTWKGLSSKRTIPCSQVSPTQLRRLSPAADPPPPAHFIWSQHPRGGKALNERERVRSEWLDSCHRRGKNLLKP